MCKREKLRGKEDVDSRQTDGQTKRSRREGRETDASSVFLLHAALTAGGSDSDSDGNRALQSQENTHTVCEQTHIPVHKPCSP